VGADDGPSVPTAAAASPIRIASPSTIFTTRRRVHPTARRMPISWVRSRIDIAIVFIMLMTPIATAITDTIQTIARMMRMCDARLHVVLAPSGRRGGRPALLVGQRLDPLADRLDLGVRVVGGLAHPDGEAGNPAGPPVQFLGVFQQDQDRPVLEDGEALEDADDLERLAPGARPCRRRPCQVPGEGDPEHRLAACRRPQPPAVEDLQVVVTEVLRRPAEAQGRESSSRSGGSGRSGWPGRRPPARRPRSRGLDRPAFRPGRCRSGWACRAP
jgi:hypothetical protein